MWPCFKCIRIILLEGSVHQWCMFSALKWDTFCVGIAVSGDIRTPTSTFLSYYKMYKVPSAGCGAPHCIALVIMKY